MPRASTREAPAARPASRDNWKLPLSEKASRIQRGRRGRGEGGGEQEGGEEGEGEGGGKEEESRGGVGRTTLRCLSKTHSE